MIENINVALSGRIDHLISKNSEYVAHATSSLFETAPEWHLDSLNKMFMALVVTDNWAKFETEDRELCYKTFQKLQTYLSTMTKVLKDEVYFE